MSDAFQPPESSASSPDGGWGLVGVFLLLVSMASGLLLALRVLQATLTVASVWGSVAAGSLLCMASELAMAVAILGAICVASFEGGRALLWPATHGMEVRAHGVLWEFHASRGLADLELGDPGPYAEATARDLADVVSNIDAEAHPERYQQLLAAIKAKVETSDFA